VLILSLDRETPLPSHFTVKVWYPAILAHYKARRYGLKDYYRRLQIGLPSALFNNSTPTSTSTSTSSKAGDEVDTGNSQLPDKVRRALDLGRKHKFEHPLGVKSTRRYTAGFDDCESAVVVVVRCDRVCLVGSQPLRLRAELPRS
jgi:hypothetical protein